MHGENVVLLLFLHAGLHQHRLEVGVDQAEAGVHAVVIRLGRDEDGGGLGDEKQKLPRGLLQRLLGSGHSSGLPNRDAGGQDRMNIWKILNLVSR